MSYFEGFILAVPEANKELYVHHASSALPLIKEFGASRMVENWGDDLPSGERTDFRRAVLAEPHEAVVFSWFVHSSREARDDFNRRMMDDPRMEAFGDLPFDASRMIFGGFAGLNEAGPGGAFGYVDGSLVAVPSDRRDEFKAFSEICSTVFLDHGATRVVDAWEDDVADGTRTDFRKAVQAADGEAVAFGWVEWPSKTVRDAAWPNVMADPRFSGVEAPFDGKRMVFGGFTPILDG